ncbi:hypothetical protein MKEN_00281900 [Mycena kentingensis (nom. inval.)]|nr:hypothetical protein MKEN_00281900 [Mycena kentingensis (nom. inval.)]
MQFQTMQHNFIWGAFLSILGKLYSNTLLSSINIRLYLRDAASSSLTEALSPFLVRLFHTQTVQTNSCGNNAQSWGTHATTTSTVAFASNVTASCWHDGQVKPFLQARAYERGHQRNFRVNSLRL